MIHKVNDLYFTKSPKVRVQNKLFSHLFKYNGTERQVVSLDGDFMQNTLLCTPMDHANKFKFKNCQSVAQYSKSLSHLLFVYETH